MEVFIDDMVVKLMSIKGAHNWFGRNFYTNLKILDALKPNQMCVHRSRQKVFKLYAF